MYILSFTILGRWIKHIIQNGCFSRAALTIYYLHSIVLCRPIVKYLDYKCTFILHGQNTIMVKFYQYCFVNNKIRCLMFGRKYVMCSVDASLDTILSMFKIRYKPSLSIWRNILLLWSQSLRRYLGLRTVTSFNSNLKYKIILSAICFQNVIML